jgi:hypothetical protein
MRRAITQARFAWLLATAVLVVVACGGALATSGVVDPSPEPAEDRHVPLLTATGHDITVTITDESGTLLDATSGTPGDGASVEPYRVVVTNDDASTLRLVWTGGPCNADDTLKIDRTGRAFLLVEPECDGDSVAFDRILILHLSSPTDAADVQAVLQDGLDTPG